MVLQPEGPEGEETVVTLTHRGLPTEDDRRSHEAGWTEFLGILVGAVIRPSSA